MLCSSRRRPRRSRRCRSTSSRLRPRTRWRCQCTPGSSRRRRQRTQRCKSTRSRLRSPRMSRRCHYTKSSVMSPSHADTSRLGSLRICSVPSHYCACPRCMRCKSCFLVLRRMYLQHTACRPKQTSLPDTCRPGREYTSSPLTHCCTCPHHRHCKILRQQHCRCLRRMRHS